MDEQFWPIFDNSSEVTHRLSSTFNSTNVLPTTISSSQDRKSVAGEVVGTVTLIVFGIGSFANAGVLAVLVRARRHAGSSVHTLIANQSAIELLGCSSGVINAVVMLTNKYEYKGNPIVDGTICIIFEGVALHIQVGNEE